MKNRPSIIAFAYSEVGYLCLSALIEDGANVLAVYTHEDDKHEEIWFHSVKDLALSNGITVKTPDKITTHDIEEIKALLPDIIFSFYYRSMIPNDVICIPRLGAYNMHGSLLPKYRGRACVNWAVLNGETETGATFHVMTQFADKGDIVAQKSVPILFTDTGHDVFLKVADAASCILLKSLSSIESGNPPLLKQDESKATKFGRRTPEDGNIDWNNSAVSIYNLIRSVTHPFPGAFAEIEGKKTYIWRARPLCGQAKPGAVISKKPMLIGTGNGILEVLRIQPEGEPERDV